MPPRSLLLAAALMLAGCAIQRAQIASSAQEKMLGFTKEEVLACMGPPMNKAGEGTTEVWSYASGNGQTNTFGSQTGFANTTAVGGPGYASGNATGSVFGGSSTSRLFCTVNVTMAQGRVSRVNYLGPTGGPLTAGEQCAFAVQSCVK